MVRHEPRTKIWLGIACLLLAQWVAAAQAPATRPGATVRFLTKAQGQAAIVDESTEPYFKLLQPMEMTAKTGSRIAGESQAGQDECRRRYQQAVLDFSDDEMRAVEQLAGQISVATEKSFPVFARTPWTFIKVRDGLEGGRPFTRNQCVVLPAVYVGEIRRLRTDPAAQKWLMLTIAGPELAAEQLHVVRRARPEPFARMYEQLWGMVHADKLDPGNWLEARQLHDPDVADQRWVYQIKSAGGAKWIWPTQVLRDAMNPGGSTMNDAFPAAIELDGSPERGFRPQMSPAGTPVMESLFNFPQFIEKFHSQSAFSPEKAAADLFGRIVIFQEVMRVPPPEARKAIEENKANTREARVWFEKILAS